MINNFCIKKTAFGGYMTLFGLILFFILCNLRNMSNMVANYTYFANINLFDKSTKTI